MIAQKVVDAKQAQQPIGAFVTLPDSMATAFRTFSHRHTPLKLSPKKLTSRNAKKDFGT
jgi:hypothetical protein